MTTGAPILTQRASGYKLAVEIAWGADLTDLTEASWTWVDITSDVLMSDGPAGAGDITITVGRQDENSLTNPGQMTCILDNRAGRYSLGGLSPNWPYVRRGTPVRVRYTVDNGAHWNVEFQGQAVSWQPRWDHAGKFATVVLTAAGPLRQINQGTLPAQSYYAQVIPTSTLYPGLLYYWNNENGNGYEGPNQITLCYPTVPAGVTSGPAVMSPNIAYLPNTTPSADTSAFPIAGPIPSAWDFSAGYTPTELPATPNTGKLQFRWLCAFTSLITGETQPLLFWHVSTSSTTWEVHWDDAGNLWVANDAGWTGGKIAFDANNKAVMLQLQHVTSGTESTIRLDMMTFDGNWGGASWSPTNGGTVGYLTKINWVGPNINGKNTPVMQAHMTVQNQTGYMGDLENLFQGGPGETVTDRLTRLCKGAGIALTVNSSPVTETSTNPCDSMGPQYFDTLTNLLRECEATGQGILLDGFDTGLTYITRQNRESCATPQITLDASAGDLALQFAPIDDDQRTINQAQASRRNGATFTWTDSTGDLGANKIGVFSTSVNVNPSTEAALPALAQWLVHLGTIPGYRYPQVSFAFEHFPARLADWINTSIGSRLDITNISALRAQMLPTTIRLAIEGWTESINANTWRINIACSPWDAWNVGRLAAATGSTSDQVMRRDTDGSAVNTAASAGATSVSVKLTAAGKPLWTTASDDFPVVVEMAGVPVTVTAISGASSPQTFTVPAGIPKALAVNDPVRLWNPPVLGL